MTKTVDLLDQARKYRLKLEREQKVADDILRLCGMPEDIIQAGSFPDLEEARRRENTLAERLVKETRGDA